MEKNGERKLVREILNGDRTKFRIIVDRYKEQLFHIAIGYLHRETDAEEVVQQAFIKAYAQFSSFRGESKLSTWLYRITVNCSLDELSKRRRKREFIKEAHHFQELRENFKGVVDQNPEEQLLSAEKRRLVQQGIDALPLQQRSSLILQRYRGLSQIEIAQIMEISEGAVEQHLFRAKRNLKEWLIKKGI
ncbi:MAG: sigma-70 family RNA polymerase sigma factor [Bacteroidales bacterium]